MLTLNEIEKAVDELTAGEKRELHRYLEEKLQDSTAALAIPGSHSVLDIPRVQLGAVLKPQTADEDVLGEMLEGRQ